MKNNDKDNFLENLKVKYPLSFQQDIAKKHMSILDTYTENKSFEIREYLCYLVAAVFLTTKEHYPQLSEYIQFRTKSEATAYQNILKEFTKYVCESEDDKPYDITPVTKDFSAIRIILNDINKSLPPNDESIELYNSPEIKELFKTSKSTLDLVDNVDKYIHSPIHDGKKYFELRISLLQRIVDITPEEFTKERDPEPSYQDLLKDAKRQYNYYSSGSGFPPNIPNSAIETLQELSYECRSKSQDELYFAISKKSIMSVFDDPLIKNTLKTSIEFVKSVKKENAFQSDYYNVSTPFGIFELQAQSNRAYYVSVKGSAQHNSMENKAISVKNFFELVDPNDEHDIDYYTSVLDSIPADDIYSPYELPESWTEQERENFLNTPKGIAYSNSKKYREMMKRIKIKDKMQILPQHLPKEVYNFKNPNKGINTKKLQQLIDSGVIKPTYVDTNEHLLFTAVSLSPFMNVCTHTSFGNAGIFHKSLSNEFTEILRWRDTNTCLRDMLVQRLNQILENPKKNNATINNLIHITEEHDKMANKLPKDITRTDILNYCEHKLEKNIEKFNSNSELSK